MKKIYISLTCLFIFILSGAGYLPAEENSAAGTESGLETSFIEELEPQSVSQISSGGTRIVITSNQGRSQIYLNNIYHGKTKLNIENLMPGEYVLQLLKNGKYSKKYYITVKKGYALFYYVEF